MSQTSNRAQHRQRLVSVESANSSILTSIRPTLSKVSSQSLQQEPTTTKDHRPGSLRLDSTSAQDRTLLRAFSTTSQFLQPESASQKNQTFGSLRPDPTSRQDHPLLNPTSTTSRSLRQGTTSTQDQTLLSPTLTTSQSLQQKPTSIKVHTSGSLPLGPTSTQHHLLVNHIPTKSWPLRQGPTSIENYPLLNHIRTPSQPLQQGTPFSEEHTLPRTVISHLTRITPHTTLTASQKLSVSDISPSIPVFSTSRPNGNTFSSSRGLTGVNIYPVPSPVSTQPTATQLSILHLNLSEIRKLQTEYPGRIKIIYMAITHTSTLSPHTGVKSSSTTSFPTSSERARFASIRHKSTVEDIKLATASNTGTGSSIILQPTPYPERISIYSEYSALSTCTVASVLTHYPTSSHSPDTGLRENPSTHGSPRGDNRETASSSPSSSDGSTVSHPMTITSVGATMGSIASGGFIFLILVVWVRRRRKYRLPRHDGNQVRIERYNPQQLQTTDQRREPSSIYSRPPRATKRTV